MRPQRVEPLKPLETLQHGTLTLKGRFVWGSNYTFLVEVEHEGNLLQAVYKPTRGERPLWDFPEATLAHREVAAYLVSEALGWELVPPTVYRSDGLMGAGSAQLFIDHDPEYHYFNMSPEDRQRLRPVVLFDLLVNNADRKGSHLLKDAAEHVWLIDHGICFHVEDKLRTVIWDFAGEPIPAGLLASLESFHQRLEHDDALGESLGAHLALREVQALGERAAVLLESRCFPDPGEDRRFYPWPPV